MSDTNLYGAYSDVPECIRDAADSLGAGEAVADHAIDLADEALDDPTLTGRAPTTIAAAALYAALLVHDGERRSQHRVAAAAGSNSSGIRKTYRVMLDAVGDPRDPQE